MKMEQKFIQLLKRYGCRIALWGRFHPVRGLLQGFSSGANMEQDLRLVSYMN